MLIICLHIHICETWVKGLGEKTIAIGVTCSVLLLALLICLALVCFRRWALSLFMQREHSKTILTSGRGRRGSKRRRRKGLTTTQCTPSMRCTMTLWLRWGHNVSSSVIWRRINPVSSPSGNRPELWLRHGVRGRGDVKDNRRQPRLRGHLGWRPPNSLTQT